MTSRTLVISVAAIAFLVLSAELARFLSVENAERDAVLALLSDQVRGDAPGMLARLRACDAACRSAVAHDASSLRGSGALKILNTDSRTAYSLTGATGLTRVAWKQAGRLPVVQCVRVKRTGDAASGISVSLLSVGRPIAGTADC